jgi:hypothetical protein
MTQSSNHPGDRRRLLLGAGGAALALGAGGTAQASMKDTRPTTPTYDVSRTRYSTSASAFLPTRGDTYVLPLSQVLGTDHNVDSTLNADNSITINHAGNYRFQLSVDWSPGKGHDAALRSYGIRRRRTPFTVPPGGALIKIVDTDEHLATQDMPGSATPKTVRLPAPPDGAHGGITPFPWAPGTIALGGYASIDITMPIPGIVAPGDVALASLTSITDAMIGANAVSALLVSAKVIAADKVRVTIFNPAISPSVTIPQGDLQVLGMSAQLTTGGSGGARTLLSSTTVAMNAGDRVYATFSSLQLGDVMQTSSNLFLEVEKWTQTA